MSCAIYTHVVDSVCVAWAFSITCVGAAGQRDAAEQIHRVAQKHADVVDLIPKALMRTISHINKALACACALKQVGKRRRSCSRRAQHSTRALDAIDSVCLFA
jgi:hypothetical protein